MTKVNLRQTAIDFKDRLDRIHQDVIDAKTDLNSNRHSLVTVYSRGKDLLEVIGGLVSSGLVASVLGPYLDEEYGVNWASLEPSYNNLKDVTLPTLVNKIKEHESEVVCGTLRTTKPYCEELNAPLSGIVNTELVTALDNVIIDLNTLLL